MAIYSYSADSSRTTIGGTVTRHADRPQDKTAKQGMQTSAQKKDRSPGPLLDIFILFLSFHCLQSRPHHL